MDLHRVRRLAATLVASQLRSGRSSSNPRSFTGRPELIATADVLLFLGTFALSLEVTRVIPMGQAASLGAAVLPFLPLAAVGVVLVAGLMFELTTTAKFAGSDAANWLPISPFEFLLASVSAIAYTYSPAVAVALGALGPLAIAGGLVPLYAATAVFAVVALVEGGILVEMIRAVTQRTSAVSAGRRGEVNLALRAVALILVILLLQLAFNPVFLLGIVQRLSTIGVIAAALPFFWSTEALTQWAAGNLELGAGFAVAQLAFLSALAYLATDLRERYWAPTATEVRLEAHRYAARNPLWAFFGLSAAESAIVSKDLRGLVRRREMLPTLVVPIVLVVLVLIEGNSLGAFVSVLWVGWVAGFFALLMGGTSVGQERKAFQTLLAFPISSGNLVRAKAAFVLLPSILVAGALTVVVGVFFALSPGEVLGALLLIVAASSVLTFWGLTFAARFSDFQDRPRPQFLRPGGMLAATGSGMVLLFAILIPGTFALLYPSAQAVPLALACAALALGVGGLAVHWTVSGFRHLSRELPF